VLHDENKFILAKQENLHFSRIIYLMKTTPYLKERDG